MQSLSRDSIHGPSPLHHCTLLMRSSGVIAAALATRMHVAGTSRGNVELRPRSTRDAAIALRVAAIKEYARMSGGSPTAFDLKTPPG
mmetsp:Transcript_10519/g.31588  ORF Transcript_10519/g.31588 Transcript_10519/m.31588 type:complete len:87 (-) Transcript_10519:1561-1821(-)